MLTTTTRLAAAKEASAQDISVVRYHLLEMKLLAGKLAPATFCSQARAELQSMAAAEGDEETKAGIAGRSDRIDQMTASTELCPQATALIDNSPFGIAEPA